MVLRTKINGEWKQISDPKVKISNEWKSLTKAFVKVSGEWKEVFSSAQPENLSLFVWGYNTYGRLGTEDSISKSSPVQLGSTFSENIKQLSVLSQTMYPTFILKTNGDLFGFGYNNYGTLGQGDTIHRSSPVQVGGSWKSISGANATLFGIKNDNTLWCWGQNINGVLGQNDTIHRSSPVQVGNYEWNSVFCYPWSNATTFAVRSDGTLWGWGTTGSYALLGDSINRSSPIQIGTDSDWLNTKTLSVNESTNFVSFLKSDGTIWGWGRNYRGHLAQNDNINRSSPVLVASNVVSCDSTNENIAFIKNDGTLWITGYNAYGVLGQNLDPITWPQSNIAVQIGSETNWKKVQIFGSTSTTFIALKTDGTLWGCGYNLYGILGQNDTIHRSSPIQIGGADWKNFMCTQSTQATVLAIKTDGTLWGWGSNSYGNICQPTVLTHFSSPVQIGSDTNWDFIYETGFVQKKG